MNRLKIHISLILLSCLLAGTVVLLSWRNGNQLEEINSYKASLESHKKEIQIWKDNEGLWRSKLEVSLITSRDALKTLAIYDERFNSLSSQFDGLKKNLSNLNSVNFSSSSSNYNITTKIKDSVIINNKDTSKFYVFNYCDPEGWYITSGKINYDNKILSIKIESKDSISSVVYWKRKWLLGRKKFYQEVKSFNPNTKIKYSESIIFKKKN
jgi:hypothetical protein